jgi:TPR repeat protein
MTRAAHQRLLAALLVVIPFLHTSPVGAAPDGKRYALLVGVREYDHARLPELKHTEHDVEELATILRDKNAGFDKVTLLTTTRGKDNKALLPTAANIRAAIKQLLAGKTKRDLVLVGLAGHGVQLRIKGDDGGKGKNEAFFCPADAQLNDASTMVGLTQLFNGLDACGARVKLLLVDACRNDPHESRNVDIDTVPHPPRGTAALFSCASGQRAFETAKLGKKGHGVFFHFVLEGLKGAAMNEGKEVTWERLTEYVRKQVSYTVPRLIGGGAKQEPHLVSNFVGEPPVLLRIQVEAGRGSLGTTLDLLDATGAERLGLARAGAVRIRWPIPGLACERAGLKRGDVILSINGADIENTSAFYALTERWEVGQKLKVEVLRQGRRKRFELMLSSGPKKKEDVVDKLRASAEKGDLGAQLELALMSEVGGWVSKNLREAAKWYRKAADQGDAEARWHLASMCMQGRGVAPNATEAAKWYRKAAEQNHARAQLALGLILWFGRGVPTDPEQAVGWFRKAARQGAPHAYSRLGKAYETGRGVEKDKDEAVRWYLKAAEADYVPAQALLAMLYAMGKPEERDHRAAKKWAERAAAKGNANAKNVLGTLYANGWGVPRDDVKAAALFRDAADRGNRGAQFNWGLMCEKGRGVKKDPKKAAQWYRRAAQKGHHLAQNNLGLMYQNGSGVEQDYDEAIKWFQKAAAQGYFRALCNIADMYRQGQGVPKDRSRAKKYYLLAKEKGDEEAVRYASYWLKKMFPRLKK